MIENVPAELKVLPQWVCVGPNKVPLDPKTMQAANVMDPGTWSTFEQACARGTLVGFVFTKNDPYGFIDLDAPHTEAQQRRHALVFSSFDTYAETSVSGQGAHMIFRGAIPEGARRDRIEIYTDGRYAIMTGNVLKNVAISDQQQMIEVLYREIKAGEAHVGATLVEQDELISDASLVELASRAANGEKFDKLCAGDWQSDYPSQSEADYALLNILCFYTQSNEQVRRLFRHSKLVRDKSARNDKYLNRAIAKIRSEEPPPVDLSNLQYTPQVQAEPAQADAQQEELPLPDGLLGLLATYLYNAAQRPVREVALAGAIGLLAGIAGRQYCISGMGLNQYLLLVAPSGTGKEAAASGIDALLMHTRTKVPAAKDFQGPAIISSGQALLRVLEKQPCLVSVIGEFGIKLGNICRPNSNSSDSMLLAVLLDLYSKSGPNRVLNPMVYSDSTKNTTVVQSPAFTMLGETTGETLYSVIGENEILSGLVPRMLLLEYRGALVPRNVYAGQAPDADTVQALADLMATVLQMSNNNAFYEVGVDPDANEYLSAIELKCDTMHREAETEVVRVMWSRVHAKVLRLAALAAVGRDRLHPTVSLGDARFASTVVLRGTHALLERIAEGDVLSGGTSQEDVALRAVRAWYELRPAQRVPYSVSTAASMQNKVVPLGFIRSWCTRRKAFKEAREGASRALENALRQLVLSGDIAEVPAQQAQELGLRARCYVPL